MAPVVVVGILTLRSKAARDQVIEQLAKVHDFSLANEPGVVKHCSTIPRDPSDVKSLYIIEEYVSQAAFDAHAASPAIKALTRWFRANAGIFEDTNQFLMLEPFCGFTRHGGDPAALQPFITLGTLQYESGAAAERAKTRWKEVSTLTERNEKRGTLSHQVMVEKGQDSVLRWVEIFENGSWRDQHAKAAYVVESNEADLKERRKWITMLELKVAGGFLGRPVAVKAVL